MILTFTLPGQVKAGKNHVQVGRGGHRYPLPAWAAWRNEMVIRIRAVMSMYKIKYPITVPCKCTLVYTMANRHKRDLPGLRDSLYHCFEKAGLIADDSLFVAEAGDVRVLVSKEHAGVWIQIETEFVRTA